MLTKEETDFRLIFRDMTGKEPEAYMEDGSFDLIRFDMDIETPGNMAVTRYCAMKHGQPFANWLRGMMTGA